MKVITKGHKYRLDHLKGDGYEILQFLQDHPDFLPVDGTSCQEVIRALIDRVQVLNDQLPWSGNADIISHLRQALAGFEARALIRKVEKYNIPIEQYPLGDDGHLKVEVTNNISNAPAS